MSQDLDMLPPDVQAILLAERDRVSAPDVGRRRLAERLSVAVPAFGPPHMAPSVPAPAPTVVAQGGAAVGALKAGVVKAVLALAIGGSVVATLGIRHHAGNAERSAHAEPARAATVEAMVAPPVVSREVAREETPPATTAVAPAAARAEQASTALRPPSLSPSASLREERRLLDEARDAIVRGEPEGALSPTALHLARFPDGVLAEERDAIRIRALAHLGRRDDARTLLRTMQANHPHSFLLEGAANDVDTIP